MWKIALLLLLAVICLLVYPYYDQAFNPPESGQTIVTRTISPLGGIMVVTLDKQLVYIAHWYPDANYKTPISKPVKNGESVYFGSKAGYFYAKFENDSLSFENSFRYPVSKP